MGKLIPLVLFIAVGLFLFQHKKLLVGGQLRVTGSSRPSCLLLIYAFSGFEMAIHSSRRGARAPAECALCCSPACSSRGALHADPIVSIGNAAELAASKRPLADAATLSSARRAERYVRRERWSRLPEISTSSYSQDPGCRSRGRTNELPDS